ELEQGVLRGLRGTLEGARRQEALAADEDVALLVEPGEAEPGAREARARDEGIDPVALELLQEVGRVAEIEVQPPLRLELFEPRQAGHEPAHPELEARSDRELEGKGAIVVGDLAAAPRFVERPLRLRQEALTRRSQSHLAGGP